MLEKAVVLECCLLLCYLSIARLYEVRLSETQSHGRIVSGTPQVRQGSSWYPVSYTSGNFADEFCQLLGCYSGNGSNTSGNYDGHCFYFYSSSTVYFSRYDICTRLRIHCITTSDLPQIRTTTAMERSLNFGMDNLSCLPQSFVYKLVCRSQNNHQRKVTIGSRNMTDLYPPTINGSHVTVNGLYPHTPYSCNIEEFNAENEQLLIRSSLHYVNSSTLSASPSPPLRVNYISAARYTRIEWSPPQFPNGSVTYSIVCESISRNRVLTVLGVTIQNLHPYTRYVCCISARNAIGVSSPKCVIFQTLESAPTGPPQNIQVSGIGARYVLLSWAPPVQGTLNGQLRNYAVTLLDRNNNQSLSTTAAQESVTLSSLKPYKKYSVSVSAVTVGVGPKSHIQFQTNEAAPTAPPVILRMVSFELSFQVQLEPPPEEHHNGIITGYSALATEGASDSVLLVVNTTSSIIDVGNLRPLTQYNFKAAAHTSAGIGVYTKPVLITTLPAHTSTSIHFTVGLSISAGIVTILIIILIIVIMCIAAKKRQINKWVQKHSTKHLGSSNPRNKAAVKGDEMAALGFDKTLPNDYIPQHVIVKGTTQFLNKKNFDLFIETNAPPEKESKEHSCNDDLPPELPERGYLEDGNNINEIPELPPRRYMEEDNATLPGNEGDTTSKLDHQHKHTSPLSNPSMNTSGQTLNPVVPTRSFKQGTNGSTTLTGGSTDMGQIIKKFKKSKDQLAKEDNSSTGDYTPLDFSTLDRRQAQTSGLQDVYMTLTKQNSKESRRPSLDSKKASEKKDSDKEIETDYECVDMNFRRAQPIASGNRNDSPYMPLTASTMTRETAGLAKPANLKKTASTNDVSSPNSEESTNTEAPYMILNPRNKEI